MPVDIHDPVATAFRVSYGRIVGQAPLLDDDVDVVAARAPEPTRPSGRPVWQAVVAAAVVLVAVGAVALVAGTERNVLGGPGGEFEPDLVAFVAEGTDHEPIRAALEASPYVSDWRLFTKADALREAREDFADDPELLAIIEADPDVLPESYRIRADPAWWSLLTAELEATPGVRLVMTNDERAEQRSGG